MPAILTLGGIALAVIGLVVVIAGMPDRAAGLGLGSDLIQAGASLFAGGLIVAALGVVLKALRDIADRVEEAGFGLSGPRPSLNDELAEQTPMPLPRASARNAVAAQPEDQFAEATQPSSRDARAPRTPREPQPVTRPPRQPQPQPLARAPRPAPEAQRPQPNFAQQPDQEFEDEFNAQREEPQQQPRWMRAQAGANNQPKEVGVIPSTRQNRATLVANANPPRREPAPSSYDGAPLRRRPASESEFQEAAPAEATVVRSGIIAGMAYTLYSDGSIEAELPAGTVRFGSLTELQEHVKRAGADDQDADYRGSNTAQH
jgi:hypothetical protein